jgi:Barstar (barnase inhibitor)
MLRFTDLTNPNWECIHFADESQVRNELNNASNAGLATFRVSVEGVRTDRELLARIATAMQFPGYFGGNWDAFQECLRDMSWLPSKSYVLILENSLSLWQSTPQAGGSLIESWLFVAQEWAQENVSLQLVFSW